jgi:hypothetical protein
MELETPLQVSVNCVLAVIAVVGTVPCTPLVGLILVENPLVPVTVHDAGGFVIV